MILFPLLLCCFGCGQNGDGRAAVAGRVTLDGDPIATGAITFYPIGEAKGCTAGGDISNGQFSIQAAKGPVIGRNRVEICAMKTTGRKIQAPLAGKGVLTDEIVQIVPDRYNAKSILECDVKQGKNPLDFELTTR
jgi:hypothetical protein